jgi:hypothetical protein
LIGGVRFFVGDIANTLDAIGLNFEGNLKGQYDTGWAYLRLQFVDGL